MTFKNGIGVWRWIAGTVVAVLIMILGTWAAMTNSNVKELDARLDICDIERAEFRKDIGYIRKSVDEIKVMQITILDEMKGERK